MFQPSLFVDPEGQPSPKPVSDAWEQMRVMITVKAAPNPSDKYGETVCVAGLRLDDPLRTGWVRLYPLNYRELDRGSRFKKYAIVSLQARPARKDQRHESWRPNWESVKEDAPAPRGWLPRRRWIDEHREGSMCRLNREARVDRTAKSLALITPAEVLDFEVKPHGGWTVEQQRKIDEYRRKGELVFEGEKKRRPPQLEAPRFKGFYRYRCHDSGCGGHRQQLLDWEFVALQRRLEREGHSSIPQRLRETFLDHMCAPGRDTSFYVGNMGARPHIFSTLGVYWPHRLLGLATWCWSEGLQNDVAVANLLVGFETQQSDEVVVG